MHGEYACKNVQNVSFTVVSLVRLLRTLLVVFVTKNTIIQIQRFHLTANCVVKSVIFVAVAERIWISDGL